MSILASRSLQCFSIFQRSMIQANKLPLCEVLDTKAKIPIATIKKITLRLASQAELGCLEFDDLTTVLDSDQAEERLSPRVIAEIRALPIGGRIITSEMTTRSVRSESVIPNERSNGRVGRARSGCRKKSIDARLNSLRCD